MKRQLLIILIGILSFNCFSQISFEKGYYITNSEQKIECLIKNIDWMNNPTEFEYKLTENTEQSTATIKSVKEFGVYDYSKYVRSTVEIDRSSNNINELSPNRNATLVEEVLFLKVLVEGQSNLYHYNEGSLVRFFYSKDNLNTIEQLIYKTYRFSGDIIKENNRFRQQLLNNLKCQNIQVKDIENLRYKKDDLVKFFLKYNQCNNSEVVNFEERQKKDLFNLTPRIGLSSASLSIENVSYNYRNVDFGSKLGLRAGVEVEFIMPFNKNKWSIIVEPTYQYFKAEKDNSYLIVKADYTSFELPIGIRHYFFINDNSKLFINGSYVLDIPGRSTISYGTVAQFEISKSSNLGFGVGYKQNDKYSLELRYQTSRKVLNQYRNYYSDYNTLSVMLGYSIF